MKVRALGFLLALTAAACDRAPTGALPPPEPPPPVVAVDSSVAVVRIVENPDYRTGFALRVGEPTIATAILLDSKGDTIRGEGVAWSVSDSTIVRLSASDDATFTYLTGRGFGTAVVTATAGDARDSVVVEVIPSPLAIYPYRFGQEVDTLRTLSGTSIRPHVYVDSLGAGLVLADSSQLAWSSSDPAVASVDGSGRVRSLSPGVAEIRVVRGAHQEESRVVTVEEVRYASITTGDSHGCGVTTDGEVVCWGSTRFGQTGVSAPGGTAGLPDSPVGGSHDPMFVETEVRFASIAAGPIHTCGLTPAGTAYCWGYGEGTGRHTGICLPSRSECDPTPTAVPDAPAFRSLDAAGQEFNPTTCGLTLDGEAYCWGGPFDPYGRLGRGSTETAGPAPAPVVGSTRFSALGVGLWHACGVDPEGVAHCWGGNYAGQLGIGGADTLAHPAPAPVSTDLRFVAVDAGGNQSCGLAGDGTVYCWGAWAGEVEASRISPTRVASGARFTHLSVGSSHACALTTSGQAYCQGGNTSGQLGNGEVGGGTDRFRQVDTGLRFTALEAGIRATCGIASDGIAYCWGEVPGHGSSPHPIRIAGQP